MDAVGCSQRRSLVLLLTLCSSFALADHFDQGPEYARANDWNRAREEFLAGHRDAPNDKRYLIELGGVEFRANDYDAAYRYLHEALRIDPEDTYVHDFLGSLHHLQGNEEAALLHWNRAGRPKLASVKIQPPPRGDAPIIDRAVAFAAGDTLTLTQYRNTNAWLTSLDVFETYRVDLAAAPNNAFDATLRWNEMPVTIKLLSLGVGAIAQQGEWRWRNAGTTGASLLTFARWDAQRRRAYTSYSTPLRGRPQVRFQLDGDSRSETWNLRQPTDFRVRKWDSGASLRFIPSSRFSWESGVRIGNRSFPGAPQFLAGASLKHVATARYQWLNDPEHRLLSEVRGAIDSARLFGSQGGYYGRTEWTMETRWLPEPTGQDWETVASLRAGGVWGQAPIDEWFMLTLNRDYDIPLRGHNGTRRGKRGSAPIARRYVLANLEAYKQIWRGPFVVVDA